MYGPPYYQRRGRPRAQQGGGRRNNDLYLIYVLISTCLRHVSELDYKPPITIALLVINILVHILPELFLPWGIDFRSVRGICLQPARILEVLLPSLFAFFSIFDSSSGGRGRRGRGSSWAQRLWEAATGTAFTTYSSSSSSSSWWSPSAYDRWHEGLSRTYLSALVHGDDVHLYYNMLSLLYKGVTLERALGSPLFLRLVLFSWAVSHTLILLLASFLHTLPFIPPSFTSFYTCSVGFSAVLFSLKYVAYSRDPTGWTSVAGFQVPLGKASWIELVVTSFLSPNASFAGHLCGIVAGVLWVEGGKVDGWVRGRMREVRRRYTYRSGASGYHVPPTAPSQPGMGGGRAAGRAGRREGGREEGSSVTQEATRRAWAEQQRQPVASGRRSPVAAAAVGGGPEGMEGLYRPLYPHVPVAEVVDVDDGPRLPTYEEATRLGWGGEELRQRTSRGREL
ncbi:rhomboid-related protein 4 [Nannochloropsis oceanica]